MPTARLHEVSLETIHDQQVQIDELTSRSISLQASLDAAVSELDREHEANERLGRERDYFKAFGVEIATRLISVREAIDAVLRAAELAGYKPNPVKSFSPQASDEAAETALGDIGKRFGANGAQHEEVGERIPG